MVECAISVLLVGGMVVACLHTVGASVMAQSKTGLHGQAQLLAGELMTEILQQAYEDSDAPIFGIEPTDGSTTVRTGFDDVDDYKDWTASPPQKKSGTVQNDLSGWTQTVKVNRVESTNLNQNRIFETGIKKITVALKFKGATLASITAIKTKNEDAKVVVPKEVDVFEDITK